MEVGREVGELHYLGTVHKFPPLHVAVIIRREEVEDAVSILNIYTCSVRRTHLEPGSVPEYRSELLHHLFSVAYLTCRTNKYLTTLLQRLLCHCIERIGHIYIVEIAVQDKELRCLSILLLCLFVSQSA